MAPCHPSEENGGTGGQHSGAAQRGGANCSMAASAKQGGQTQWHPCPRGGPRPRHRRPAPLPDI
eukprot:4486807-Prorocentrum_lima.AAC.1